MGNYGRVDTHAIMVITLRVCVRIDGSTGIQVDTSCHETCMHEDEHNVVWMDKV